MKIAKSNEELHRELWGWLAETGKKKDEWPGWYGKDSIEDAIGNRCFACNEAGWVEVNELLDCEMCPIIWFTPLEFHGQCQKIDSPYRLWEKASSEEVRKYWAAIVRDLPWRSREVKND